MVRGREVGTKLDEAAKANMRAAQLKRQTRIKQALTFLDKYEAAVARLSHAEEDKKLVAPLQPMKPEILSSHNFYEL